MAFLLTWLKAEIKWNQIGHNFNYVFLPPLLHGYAPIPKGTLGIYRYHISWELFATASIQKNNNQTDVHMSVPIPSNVISVGDAR